MEENTNSNEILNLKHSHSLSIDDMWRLSNRQDRNWGIEGYEIQKKYFDHAKQKKNREITLLNEKVWSKKGKYDKPPVKLDKNGKPIMTKRPNYIDDHLKIVNSLFDKDKFEKLSIELKDKSLKPYSPRKNFDVRRSQRLLFTDLMIKDEKKKWEENKNLASLDKLKDKIKEHNKEKQVLAMDILKKKYVGVKKGTSSCDRVSFTSEAMFIGENIPFYNSPPPKDGQDKFEDIPGGEIKEQVAADKIKGGKAKKNKVLFFPRKYCLSSWTKAPKWVYKKPIEKSSSFNYNVKEEAIKAKVEQVKSKLEKIGARVDIDVPKSWHEVNYRGRYYVQMHPDIKKSEKYEEWKKNNPPKSPSPQHYFRTYKLKYISGKKSPIIVKPPESEDNGLYRSEDRSKKLKSYKPLKIYIF